MSRNRKGDLGLKRILAGTAAETIVCFMLLSIAAGLLERGTLGEQIIIPLLCFTVLISAFIGSCAAGRAVQDHRRIYAMVPAGILAAGLALGRAVTGPGHTSGSNWLIVICALLPGICVGFKRSGKKR